MGNKNFQFDHRYLSFDLLNQKFNELKNTGAMLPKAKLIKTKAQIEKEKREQERKLWELAEEYEEDE